MFEHSQLVERCRSTFPDSQSSLEAEASKFCQLLLHARCGSRPNATFRTYASCGAFGALFGVVLKRISS